MADHQEMHNALLRAIQKGAEDMSITVKEYIDLFYEDNQTLQQYAKQLVLS